jgi:glycosyltransferase involved in cell wall biosynthesis
LQRIAIVIPVLNEAAIIEDSLKEIAGHLNAVADTEFTFVLVNDGSDDNTLEILDGFNGEVSGNRLETLSLSRRYGKESAIHAGLSAATAYDAAIIMDSDLQHPPQLIPDMVRHWQQGSLVVEGVKVSRGSEALSRRLFSRLYYRLFHLLTGLDISADTDFKLIDRSVVQRYCALPETNRFFRGLIKWMGVTTTQIPFDVPPASREHSSWQGLALMRYAITTISSFTSYPLQLVTLLGVVTFILSLVIGGIALLDKMTGAAVDGFTTVILLILIIGSVLMFSLGLIGIYLGKIFEEVKRRPNFMLDEDSTKLNTPGNPDNNSDNSSDNSSDRNPNNNREDS